MRTASRADRGNCAADRLRPDRESLGYSHNRHYSGSGPHPTGGAAAREVEPVATLLARKGGAMEKYMCYGALGVAALMFLLFLLDLVAEFPFGGGPFMLADIL